MKFGIIILCALLLFLLAGVVPGAGGLNASAIYYSPIFILTAAALAGSLILCSVQRRRWRKVPFLLCHLGVVLILAGAMARFVWGEKYEVTIPVARNHRALNLRMPDGTARPLGFGLSVTKFSVEFYDSAARKTPKVYEAQLEFSMPDNTAEQARLAVNHPVFHGGWWFHLQSYDARAGRYVILAVKRDPGLWAVTGGFWMLIIGTFLICFRREGGAQ